MSNPGGYVGKILDVDLSTGALSDRPLDESDARHFIGGYGLGARELYRSIPAGTEPLGPDNIIGFITGPLTGTPALMGNRYCVVAKSPLTGGWGDANSGGAFGPALKFAGYDAVLIRGRADHPTYLLIENGRPGLRPAGDLWGRDTVQTEEALQRTHGANLRAACIGPAGEKLVRFACVINDRGRAAGRSGLGAVMGSKRLKAIAVQGDLRPPVARPEVLDALRRRYLPELTGDATLAIRTYGTPAFTSELIKAGRTPIRNWQGSYPDGFPNTDAFDGTAVIAHQVKKYACWHCPVACGGMVRWESRGAPLEAHKPEYETLGMLGSNCCITDVKAVMELNDFCNRMGMDTISAGAVVAFAMECFERGVLRESDLGGSALRWGDGAAAAGLLGQIVARTGAGNVLAEGVARASRHLGQGSEAYAIHAGGQELPAHDPRHAQGYGLAYAISPTPGRHTQGGPESGGIPDALAIRYGVAPSLKEENPVQFRAQLYAAFTAWMNVINSAGLCVQSSNIEGPEFVPEFIAAVTGWDFDLAECMQTGERIEVMRNLFGHREGFNALKTQVAPRAMGRPPLSAGPTAGVQVDVQAVRDEYLRLMDWSAETGAPSSERLERLGLVAP